MRHLALSAVLLATPVSAQCPAWSPGFDAAGQGIQGSVSSLVTFDDGSGPALYAAGRFANAGSSGAVNIARWDGSQWAALQPGVTFSSSFDYFIDLVAFDDGSGPALFACGDFFMTVPGVGLISNVAHWDGTSWGAASWAIVDAAAVYDDGLGTGPRLFTALYSNILTNDVFRREPSGTWSYVCEITGPQSLFFQSMTAADLGNGPRLYMGNSSGAIWMLNAGGVVGVTAPPFASCNVHALLAFDDGGGEKLYAGGSRGSGASASGFLARYDGTTWIDVGGTIPLGAGGGAVYALASHDFGSGPEIVAAGRFTSIAGTAAASIARFDGTTWSPLESGLAGGSGAFPFWMGLASVDEGDGAGPSLFVGGEFTQAGGTPSEKIARYRACGGPVELFCFGDGSATACPCGNVSAIGAEAGCLNSLGIGGTLRVSGQASLSDDSLRLEGAAMTNSSALYYQAGNVAFGGAGFAFGDGLKCTASPFVRLRNKTNVGGTSSYPEPGDASISVKGFVTSPGTKHYQVHYRNAAAFCTPETFNHTNAATITWAL